MIASQQIHLVISLHKLLSKRVDECRQLIKIRVDHREGRVCISVDCHCQVTVIMSSKKVKKCLGPGPRAPMVATPMAIANTQPHGCTECFSALSLMFSFLVIRCHNSLLFIRSEDVCNFDTLPEDATLSFHSGVYRDVITSSCHRGYSFSNHSTLEFIECLELGLWSKVPEACHRK